MCREHVHRYLIARVTKISPIQNRELPQKAVGTARRDRMRRWKEPASLSMHFASSECGGAEDRFFPAFDRTSAYIRKLPGLVVYHQLKSRLEKRLQNQVPFVSGFPSALASISKRFERRSTRATI